MKTKIHPEYKELKVICSCGNQFVTRSTLGKDQITLEVCSLCHPFYTGTQKLLDTGGRVDRFRQKYAPKPVKVKEVIENKAITLDKSVTKKKDIKAIKKVPKAVKKEKSTKIAKKADKDT